MTARPPQPDTPDRDLNLDELSLSAERRDREQFVDAVTRQEPRRLLWVEDLRGVDVTSNPKLLRDVRSYYERPETHENFGEFVGIDDFPELTTTHLRACRVADRAN